MSPKAVHNPGGGDGGTVRVPFIDIAQKCSGATGIGNRKEEKSIIPDLLLKNTANPNSTWVCSGSIFLWNHQGSDWFSMGGMNQI